MLARKAESTLRSLASQFKALAVVGPRQSGKTTLVRMVFPDKPYSNLENPDTRRFAVEDPRGFLARYPNGAILDEVQRAPELFSYLQQILDDGKEPGRFILTGSNNFQLQQNISQPLAGRIAYLTLLPFSLDELPGFRENEWLRHMVLGFYPPVYDQPVEAAKWYANYIHTYIERDVRQLKNITNLLIFEKFLRLCAGRSGQLLNMNSLAVECGIDNKTVNSWLSVLENSFITFKLQPYHQNFHKRVVKMAKLYFYDTGLLCALLGIHNTGQMQNHPLAGNIFENMMVSEYMKYYRNKALVPPLFFWRDNNGREIDLLLDMPDSLYPIEIKYGSTIHKDYSKNLRFWQRLTGNNRGAVLYTGEEKQIWSNGIHYLPWNKFTELEGLDF
ncbi:MAG: ATP-binding protein [Bacteroidales bacterium]